MKRKKAGMSAQETRADSGDHKMVENDIENDSKSTASSIL